MKYSRDLQFVPDDIKDYTLCLTAAQSDTYIARFIPHEYFTPELCLALTKRGTWHFKDIPKDCLTVEACTEAVKHRCNQFGDTVLGEIPRHLINQEICNIAIKTSVRSFEAIPEEFVTEEILMYVADKAPWLLTYKFPSRFRNNEFCKRLAEKYPRTERVILQWIVE